MEGPLISVIIPIYNVQDYLEVCIESVLSQTYGNIEVILVDDGSTDNCNVICKRYCGMDDRVMLVEKENGGLVSARKAGLERAGGTYILFVDADDWVDNDLLEKIVPFITGGNSVDMVAFGCIEEYPEHKVTRINKIKQGIYRNNELRELQHSMFMTDYFFDWNILPNLWDKVIRKDVLARSLCNVPNEVSYGEDVACTYPCILCSKSVAVLDITPYHYRQRDGSMVREMRELPKGNFENLYRTLAKAFVGDGFLEKQLKYYMFFVMLLKSYSTFSNLMPLFPFKKVKPGDRVLVYGAGGFGKVIASYVSASNDLELVGWADKNAGFYRKSGFDIILPKDISSIDFDSLVIAILNETTSEIIMLDLVDIGVNSDKIDFVQKNILKDYELSIETF
jgi:glycosyltransferase involved in cell wall biosynthesis